METRKKVVLLLLLPTWSFDLMAFQGGGKEAGHYVQNRSNLSTSTLTGLALVPSASDDVIEAGRSRNAWQGEMIEFVHIHKCGGSTFNQIVPAALCTNDTHRCTDPTCCLVRPSDPGLPEALAKVRVPPKYVSAKEEFSAVPKSSLNFYPPRLNFYFLTVAPCVQS